MAEEIKDSQAQNQPESTVETYSEAEYNTLKSQLDEANKAIQSYKDMDIDGIKKSVEDYKTKFEQSEADRKAFEHKTKIDGYVKSLGLKDDIYENHITNLLIEKGLQFDGDKLIGGDDVVNGFKATHADAFKPNMLENVVAPTSNNPLPVVDGVTKAFLDKNPEIKL